MRTQSSLKFRNRSGFYPFLTRAVDRYFRTTKQAKQDNFWQYMKAFILLGWLVLSYVSLVCFATTWWHTGALALSLGFVLASIGFCIQHDGNHGAFSKYEWVNYLMGLTLDLLGGSSYLWKWKHNVYHHTYTNVNGHDDDIAVGKLGRLSPEQPRYWFHSKQHIYLWFLYGFLVPKWHFVDDYANIIRGKIGNHHIKRPSGFDLVVFIGGKLLFLTLAFVIPLLFHSWQSVILTYLFTAWSMGFLLAVVFQNAHVLEETEFPLPQGENLEMERPWAEHQVRTTADFAQRNRILAWFLGGLNFQIEHHLFPKICHVHYPKVCRIVRKACKLYGLPYHVHPSLIEATMSHYRFLKYLGQPA